MNILVLCCSIIYHKQNSREIRQIHYVHYQCKCCYQIRLLYQCFCFLLNLQGNSEREDTLHKQNVNNTFQYCTYDLNHDLLKRDQYLTDLSAIYV